VSKFNRALNRAKAIGREPVGGGLVPLLQRQPDGTPQHARGLTFFATVLNTPGQLLPIDFDRHYLFIQNNDLAGVIWVSFGSPAAIGRGMRFTAGGGGIIMDQNCLTSELNAIGTIAINPNITIITG
jgi:hypothetical protein